ncbi:hypothetical protein [Streptomyces sp. ST2-7A]|uniref:hypothetical protein n=1 Tax=Streptomyces sp. ST2-7A TaxID=2907214 RepID=UPI001F30CEF9|nr:hypothetical protein [Streptomyces sp. ST2-7A]MCE7080035.1 hypothetical protein [Streptomyces sp. ST2-7A]
MAAATDEVEFLAHVDDRVAQGQLVVLGGAFDLLPLAAPAALRIGLEQTAVPCLPLRRHGRPVPC